MKCSNCGREAKYFGERMQPGQPQAKRGFCAESACFPREPGWTLYPLPGTNLRPETTR